MTTHNEADCGNSPLKKGLIQVGKEMPVQVLAALEKRFWAHIRGHFEPLPGVQALAKAWVRDCGARKMTSVQNDTKASKLHCRSRSVVRVC